MSFGNDETAVVKVVVNDEEQYSVWPADRENPLGWRDAGKTGLMSECLQYIDETWTDMRPLSVRTRMAAHKAEDRQPASASQMEG